MLLSARLAREGSATWPVAFWDPVRLAQDVDAAIDRTGVFSSERMIVLPVLNPRCDGSSCRAGTVRRIATLLAPHGHRQIRDRIAASSFIDGRSRLGEGSVEVVGVVALSRMSTLVV